MTDQFDFGCVLYLLTVTEGPDSDINIFQPIAGKRVFFVPRKVGKFSGEKKQNEMMTSNIYFYSLP